MLSLTQGFSALFGRSLVPTHQSGSIQDDVEADEETT